MLITLFSPSESKCGGGIPHTASISEPLFGLDTRSVILHQYRSIMHSGNDAQRHELTGIKDPHELVRYNRTENQELMKAIERYDGVAYKHLDIGSLDQDARTYIDEHVIIFSNLYGPIRASDYIMEYKVKQGASIGSIAPEHYYKERLSTPLDAMLQAHELLDLRANYYDRFYLPRQPYTTLKFLKDGKIVSHWAKAYRGLVLRAVAKAKTESLEAFSCLEIEGLHVNEIRTKALKTEIVYTIV
ncbi:MAG: YaaA family protein [Campylobacterales bacterium]|nr:YaaA family protein [Campylobacterales bacterium]